MKIDWHSNFMTPVFPSFNTFKRCSFYIIEIFWDIEDTNGKLGKSCRICFINITSPTSPYSTTLTENPQIDYMDLCIAVEDAMKDFIKSYMRVIGSSGQYSFEKHNGPELD